jgi:hypothetical protein
MSVKLPHCLDVTKNTRSYGDNAVVVLCHSCDYSQNSRVSYQYDGIILSTFPAILESREVQSTSKSDSAFDS